VTLLSDQLVDLVVEIAELRGGEWEWEAKERGGR
jgi:hypothetical protein